MSSCARNKYSTWHRLRAYTTPDNTYNKQWLNKLTIPFFVEAPIHLVLHLEKWKRKSLYLIGELKFLATLPPHLGLVHSPGELSNLPSCCHTRARKGCRVEVQRLMPSPVGGQKAQLIFQCGIQLFLARFEWAD